MTSETNMPLQQEISGALERPGDCRIEVYTAADGSEVTIRIPPAKLRAVVGLTMSALLLNLLSLLYVGGVLFLTGKSIWLMHDISPAGLPLTLARYQPWIVIVWLFVLAIGFFCLALIARPLLMSECIFIDSVRVRHLKRSPLGNNQREALCSEISGFKVENDPQGLSQSCLTLRIRGEEWIIGEFSDNNDKEWLASVGNILLSRI